MAAAAFQAAFHGSAELNPPQCCGAGCQPAADCQSASRHAQRIFNGLRGVFDRAANPPTRNRAIILPASCNIRFG